MNTEQENLTREIESLKHKIAETSQMVVRLEVSLTRKVSDAEGALDQYLSLLSTLGLFPPLPPLPPTLPPTPARPSPVRAMSCEDDDGLP